MYTIFNVCGAIAAGLASHQVFKRHEPTLRFALQLFVLSHVTLWAVLFFVAHLSGVALVKEFSAVSTSYLVALSSSILIYRALLHPLNEFPGPFAARLSKLWAAAVTVEGKNHLRIAELHRIYGDFVRIGPNDISIANSDAVLPIYGPRSEWTRSKWYNAVWKPPGSESVMSFRTAAQHSQRRRIWDRGFTTQALKDYHPMICERVQQLHERLDEDCVRGPVDLGKLFSFLSFDIMGSLVFDGGFDMVKYGDADGHWKTIVEGVRLTAIFANLPWTPELLAFVVAAFPWIPIIASQGRLIKFSKKTLDGRRNNGSKRKDLSYWLLGEDKGKCELSEADLTAESLLAIVAGSDTTSLTLSFMFYHLVQDPSTLALLRKEIDELYGNRVEVDIDELADLPYLTACIHEALRLYPGIPNGHPRLAPKGGAMIAGRFIPDSTTVFIPAWTLHRDPRLWSPDPEFYRPERWLDATGQRRAIPREREIFLPFSYGPYSCVGQRFAWLEMRLTSAVVVRHFDIQFAAGFDPATFDKSITAEFLLTKGVLPMMLRRRTKA